MRVLVVLTALAVALVFAPSSALAWGNGPQGGTGFGTHDWVLVAGNRLAVSQGTTWLESDVATKAASTPDSLSGDQPYHSYDRWGRRYGYANSRVTVLYRQAVAAFRASNRTEASRLVGLMSHYYADVSCPLQTDNASAENRMRSRFQLAVDYTLRTPESRSWWITYDGYQHVSDPSAFTIRAAKTSHRYYSKLVKNYNRRGFNNTSKSIARYSLVRAVNGIADLIMSVQQDAVEVGASPDVWAHQGVACSESSYYVFHTGWMAAYDRSWRLTRVNTNPLLGLTGFTQPHLGDGCYHDGYVYVVAENWPAVTNQYILVFDATTLQRVAAIPTGKTHEVASVCVAPGSGGGDALWVASYLDSSRLFEYDIDSGAYVGSKALSPSPRAGIQGVTYSTDGSFYLSVGRGVGTGSLYRASLEGTSALLYTRQGSGHHEGVEADGDRLLWLIDWGVSGSKIHYVRFPDFLNPVH